MTTSTRRSSKRIATHTAELAFAVPQVVAHRFARMVNSGVNPSARDRGEFQRMGTEKVVAFGESWNAMAWQMFRANQTLTMSLLRSWWSPWFGGRPSLDSSAQQFQSAVLSILSAGIVPVRRRAMANARRLGKAGSR